MNRTASIGSWVGPAVMSSAGPSPRAAPGSDGVRVGVAPTRDCSGGATRAPAAPVGDEAAGCPIIPPALHGAGPSGA